MKKCKEDYTIRMRNLFRVSTIHVYGFEGDEITTYSYIVSELGDIEDDDEISQDDVIEADEVFLCYSRYENIGEVSDDELSILNKFGIIGIT